MTSSIDRLEGRITTSTDAIPHTGPYRPAYGTAGYLDLWPTDADDDDGDTPIACRTADGQCAWWLSGLETGDIRVEVVQGDVEVIKALVKAEIDHFDSELVWVD